MGLFDFLSGGQDPSQAAAPYLNKIEPMERENYSPYINRGNDAYNTLSPQFEQMTKDPAAFLEMLMGSYEPSKGYGLRRDEALRSAGNSAAAGGMRGSINDINNEAHITDSLLGDDMQQWLQNVLGIQGTGMSGESHFADEGYDATKNLTGDLSNLYGTQGQLAYQGASSQNKGFSDLLSGLTKSLGMVGGWELPGSNAGTVGGKFLSKFF